MAVAILFPGQGSQYVGMGAELFDTQSALLGSSADEALGWSLREMCLQGPEEILTRTEHAQPALFAISYALWASFRAVYQGDIAGAAGHSLGEYTGLCAAESIGYLDALGVVARRGSAMAAAADLEPSGMAALIGADVDLAEQVASRRRDEGGRLEVANINAPGQVVVAGSADDIAWVADNARDLGVRRAIPLKVAGAFHSAFMAPAADEVGEALGGVDFADPVFRVWSNTTASPHETSALRGTLRSQVVSTVRFAECLEDMGRSGIDTFVHIGPGDVIAGMARRTLKDATVHVISAPDDIPGVVESLTTMA